MGELVTAAGDAVLDDGGAALALPLDAGPITVAADGTVSSAAGVAGRIGLVAFDDEQRLSKVGDGLYRERPAAAAGRGGAPRAGRARGLERRADARDDPDDGDLRAYQGTQRLLDTHHELQRRAIERMLEATG